MKNVPKVAKITGEKKDAASNVVSYTWSMHIQRYQNYQQSITSMLNVCIVLLETPHPKLHRYQMYTRKMSS